MKLRADAGVKISKRLTARSPLPEPLAITAKVLTTDSFEEIPVMTAAAAFQSPKPSGTNTGEMNLPKCARRLSSICEVKRSDMSRF